MATRLGAGDGLTKPVITDCNYLSERLPVVLDVLMIFSHRPTRVWSLGALRDAWQRRRATTDIWGLVSALDVLTTYDWTDTIIPQRHEGQPQWRDFYVVTRRGRSLCRFVQKLRREDPRTYAVARSMNGLWWDRLSRVRRARLLQMLLAEARAHLASQMRDRSPTEATERIKQGLCQGMLSMQANFDIGVTNAEMRTLFVSRPSLTPIKLH